MERRYVKKSTTMNANEIQQIMIERVKKEFDGKLPLLIDIIDNPQNETGNSMIVINTLNNKREEVELCDLRGFLRGVSFGLTK